MTRYKIQQIQQSTVTDAFYVAEEYEKELETDEEAIQMMQDEKNRLVDGMRGVRVVRYAGCGTDNYDRWEQVEADFQ